MTYGKIRTVTIGVRGTGTESDNLKITVGEPFPEKTVIVVEIIHGEEDGVRYINVFKKNKVLMFSAEGQPYTAEYDDPEKVEK